jgi:hypothetical protein
MKKNYSSFFATLFVAAIVGITFFSMMPQWTSEEEGTLTEFSTARAFSQVEAISQKPHFAGSKNHEEVANYLLGELQKLGLETAIQEGYTLSDWGNLVQSKNLLARIKGSNSSKALLLLSHYDSAPHSSSFGASDAGSGVATILESVRAFLYNRTAHKNDIIILFTDAEELGLNGAALFVTQHKWAKEVGVVLNFEARGSSGPSYMLMETNGGNAGMVQEFAAAKVPMPASNSLMYSIYKMLPNDTDLTVFREKGNIQGYNFAFIDDHFNYHTAQDDSKHLNKNSLEHQSTYLMPLLQYFSNTNFNATHSDEDYAYFTIPFTFISYPLDWVLPMVILAAALFVILLLIGLGKRILSFSEIISGFVPLVGAILTSGLITYGGWKLLLIIYPQYNDLLNGFTYNGHSYIAAFVSLSLAICFAFYQIFSDTKKGMSHFVAPLLIWVLINGAIALHLQGAGFLIIPVFFALIAFGFFILTQRSSMLLNLVCSIPTLLIVVPFIQMFPIGLGLKVLFGSAVLTVLTFALILPVFGAYQNKGSWFLLFFGVTILFFAKAHLDSGYKLGQAKSNSLLYIYDTDSRKANWVTYDTNLDQWTKSYLGSNPKTGGIMAETPILSKYNTGFTYTAKAPIKTIATPDIEFIEDRVINNLRYLKIKITPNRNVNRYDIFANENSNFYNFRANGAKAIGQKGALYERKRGKKILSYYVVGNAPLELEFSTDNLGYLNMELLECSFDLMSNPLFKMNPRESWMIPTPFVLNDAVVVRQKLLPTVVSPTLEVKKSQLKWKKNDAISLQKTILKPVIQTE